MKVFLSYADSDRVLAADLAKRLSGAGLDVFWSDLEIQPGDNWAAAVQQALERSNALVILLSPEAVESRWVRREIDYALGSPRFEGRVVPVEVRPTQEFPWFLRSLHAVQATGDLDQVTRDIVSSLRPSEN